MAIRQYVGARYVPRFMGLYDATQIYDALDVVDNGSGTSYIAKKTVPAGTSLSNTDYWFIYGASSGAIIQIQNEIAAMQKKILNKRIVVLGDSYSTGYPNYIKTWAAYCREMLGLSTDDYFVIAEDGTGFLHAGDGGHTYETLLDANFASVTDRETIDTVVIEVAYNDYTSLGGGATDAQLIAAVEAVIAKLKIYFPYAVIKMAICGGYQYITSTTDYFTRMVNDFNQCNGFSWIRNTEFVFADKQLLDGTGHPTLNGQKMLARAMYSGLITGACDVSYTETATVTMASGFGGDLKFKVDVNNADCNIEVAQLNITTPNTFKLYEVLSAKIGSLAGNNIFNRYAAGLSGWEGIIIPNIAGQVTSNGVVNDAAVSIFVRYNGDVHLLANKELTVVTAIQGITLPSVNVQTIYT